MAIIGDLDAVKFFREPSFVGGQKVEAEMACDALKDHFNGAAPCPMECLPRRRKRSRRSIA